MDCAESMQSAQGLVGHSKLLENHLTITNLSILGAVVKFKFPSLNLESPQNLGLDAN